MKYYSHKHSGLHVERAALLPLKVPVLADRNYIQLKSKK